MKKIIYILFLFGIILNNYGQTTYYVSEDGSSDNNGTSTLTPFRYPADVSWAGLSAEDSVLFKCGSAWDSVQIYIDTDTIYLGSYGTGDKPHLSGYVYLGNGSNNGDDTYTFDSDLLPTSSHNRVLNEAYGSARYSQTLSFLMLDDIGYDISTEPDGYSNYYDEEGVGDPSGGYNDYIIETDQSYTTNELVGGILDMGPENWARLKVDVTSNSGTTINLESQDFALNGSINLSNGGGPYRIKYKVLNFEPDQHGEWAIDRAAQEITIYSETSLLASDIKMAVYDSVITLDGTEGCTIDGIHVSGAITAGILDKEGTNNTIQNCLVDYCGLFGIFAFKSTGVSILNDSVFNIGCDGIRIEGCGTANIENNRISRIGMFSLGADRVMASMGINQRDKNSGDQHFRKNYIDSTGYCSIALHRDAGSTDSTFIIRNLLRYAGLETTDGGAIYTSSGTDNSSTPTLIDSNIIEYVISNSDRAWKEQDWYTMGIYIDTWGQRVTVKNNFVSRSATGFFANGCKTNEIFDNTFSRISYTGMYGSENGDKVATTNTNYMRNDIICDNSGAYGFSWWKDGAFSLNGCFFDTNRYYNPYEDAENCHNFIYTDGETSLTDFQSETGQENETTYNEHNWTLSDISGSGVTDMLKSLWNWSDENDTVDLYDVTLLDRDSADHSGTWIIPPYTGDVGWYVSGTVDSFNLIIEGNIGIVVAAESTPEAIDTIVATDTIQNEDYYSSYGGISIYDTGLEEYTGDWYLSFGNQYEVHKNINFTSINTWSVRLAIEPFYEDYIYLCVDSITDPNCDEFYIESTGDWETFVWRDFTLDRYLDGVHDIYIASLRPNLDKFTFSGFEDRQSIRFDSGTKHYKLRKNGLLYELQEPD